MRPKQKGLKKVHVNRQDAVPEFTPRFSDAALSIYQPGRADK